MKSCGGARANLSCKTKKELQQLAKARTNPIPGMWKMNKSTLVDAMSKKDSKKAVKAK